MGLSIPTFVWFGIHHSENGGHIPWKWACLSLPFVHFRILYPYICVVWDPPQWTEWACLPLPLCGMGSITVNTMGLSIPLSVWFGIHHSENGGHTLWKWACLSLPLRGLGSTTVNTLGLSIPPFVWFGIHHSEHSGLVYPSLCVVWDPPQWTLWACLSLPLCGLGSTTVNTMSLSTPTFVWFGIHHSEHNGLQVYSYLCLV